MKLEELFQIITSAKNRVAEIDFSDMQYTVMNEAAKERIIEIISNSLENENVLLKELGIKLVPDVKFDMQKGQVSCGIGVIREFFDI